MSHTALPLSFCRRHYGGDHPPRNLEPPPKGANPAAYWLLGAWNEASAGIPDWPDSKSMGTIGWRREAISPSELASSELAKSVVGGRWSWGGVEGLVFGRHGKLITPWGEGKWGLVASSGAATGEAEDGVKRCTNCLFADFVRREPSLLLVATHAPLGAHTPHEPPLSSFLGPWQANANHNLRFDMEASPPSFESVRVGDMVKVVGKKLE